MKRLFAALLLLPWFAVAAQDWFQCAPVTASDPVWKVGRLGAQSNMTVENAQQLARIIFLNYDFKAPIFIARLFSPANTYLVALSGRQIVPGQVTSNTAVAAAMSRKPSLYSSLIIRALRDMRVPENDHVHMTGHSLGGMEAENLIFDPDYRHDIRWKMDRIVTFGAPPLRYLSIDARDIRRFVIKTDYMIREFMKMMPQSTSAFAEWSANALGSLTYVDSGGRNVLEDPHSAYPVSAGLVIYDAFGDPINGNPNARSIMIDTRVMWRCKANEAQFPYPILNPEYNPRGVPFIVQPDPAVNVLWAEWPDAPGARLTMKPSGGGVSIPYITLGTGTGANPSGSAIRMIVDALRASRFTQPRFIQFDDIIEKDTTDALKAGKTVPETAMYRLMQRVLSELHARNAKITWYPANPRNSIEWLRADIPGYSER